MNLQPMPNGENGGRDRHGRFGRGNRAAAGHAAPYAAKVASLRAALLEAVSPEDIQAIAKALIEKARRGDLRAARELFDRLLGAPDRSTWTQDNLPAAAQAALDAQQQLQDRDLPLDERLLRSIGG